MKKTPAGSLLHIFCCGTRHAAAPHTDARWPQSAGGAQEEHLKEGKA